MNTNILDELIDIDVNLTNFINTYDEDSINLKKNIKDTFNNVYSTKNKEINNKILVEYLYYVNTNKIRNVKKQLNMSFQDIIYNNNKQWQVGYTGTAYLELNKYPKCDKYVFKKIIPDYDEKIEILLEILLNQ